MNLESTRHFKIVEIFHNTRKNFGLQAAQDKLDIYVGCNLDRAEETCKAINDGMYYIASDLGLRALEVKYVYDFLKNSIAEHDASLEPKPEPTPEPEPAPVPEPVQEDPAPEIDELAAALAVLEKHIAGSRKKEVLDGCKKVLATQCFAAVSNIKAKKGQATLF